MTTPTLHRTERCTEFPPEQYVSARTLETFFSDFHPFKNPTQRAVELFEKWLVVSCANSKVTLVVWCTQCYRHHEYCVCKTRVINLDQWRIPKKDLAALRKLIELKEVAFGERGNIYTLEFSEYITTHSS